MKIKYLQKILINMFIVFVLVTVDLSSASESEIDSDDSEKDFSSYACRHCYTTSKYA